MRLATACTRAQLGLAAPPVAVEAHVAGGLPQFTIIGLIETAIRESRDRVRAAIQSSGLQFPDGRITVNLAPADLPKSGSGFDLAIAVAVLVASGQVRPGRVAGTEFLGELAFSGSLRRVPGLLPALLRAREAGTESVVPAAGAAEAALLGGGRIRLAASLREVVDYLNGSGELPPPPMPPAGPLPDGSAEFEDLADIRGQPLARRALEVAAAGGHHLLLVGPPGTGKTMLARRLPGLLPPLTEDEALESAAIHSLAAGPPPGLEAFRRRPFRAPHHTASTAALVGGGGNPRPGEISLAHRGVLFLDELPEFSRPVLEALREPLGTGRVTIARALRTVEYPAAFQFVGAMNPWASVALLPGIRSQLKCLKPKDWSETPQTLGEHLRARRRQLHLRQGDVAKLLGVTSSTVLNWERGNSRSPPNRSWPAIIEFLGYDPHPEPETLPDKLRAVRRNRGWSQADLAAHLGVDPSTVADWERGKTVLYRTHRDRIAQLLGVEPAALDAAMAERWGEQHLRSPDTRPCVT